MSSYAKSIQVHLEPAEGTLGFAIRGGTGKAREDAFRVSRVDEGGPAFRSDLRSTRDVTRDVIRDDDSSFGAGREACRSGIGFWRWTGRALKR